MIKIFKTSKDEEAPEEDVPADGEEGNQEDDLGSLVQRFLKATLNKIKGIKDAVDQNYLRDKKEFRRFNRRLTAAFLIYAGLSLATGYMWNSLYKKNQQMINNVEKKRVVLANKVKNIENGYEITLAKLQELYNKKPNSVDPNITFLQAADQSVTNMNEEQKAVVVAVVNHTDNWIRGDWEQYRNDYAESAMVKTMKGWMDKEQLYCYKANLNRRNTYRHVEFQSPFEITFKDRLDGNRVEVEFVQYYDSTSYADLCDKSYELKKVGDRWLITKESFRLHQIVKNIPYKENPNKTYLAK